MAFSEYFPGAPKGGRPNKWELRRMWLGDKCARNSESRCLRIAARIIKQLCPHVNLIYSYSDVSIEHQGTIYKAAGFRFDGWTSLSNSNWNTYGDTKEFSDSGLTVKKKRWVLPL